MHKILTVTYIMLDKTTTAVLKRYMSESLHAISICGRIEED